MQRLTLSGSRLRWAARYAISWPGSVARLALLARRLDVEVVHSNSLHYLQGWAAALLARRPHLWHAREIVVQSTAALRLERLLARRYADVVVATSRSIAAQLDPGNVVVIYDRPDPAEFAPRRAGALRSPLGIADDAPLVGAACRIDTWKGVDVLLDAVPTLRAARPGTEVLVAGDPVGGKEAYADALAARAADLGVHWLGARRDMPDLLADLDVYVQASTAPEPFGLGLVEALASGCPVVATDGGGPVEILERVLDEGGRPVGGAGRLVPFRDPAATAAAVVGLLPPVTSTATRRARPRLVPVLADSGLSLAEVTEDVATGRRRRQQWRRRSGTGRRSPRRPPPR
jgi:glycosyltransferase involved in cell wall biosynthesis